MGRLLKAWETLGEFCEKSEGRKPNFIEYLLTARDWATQAILMTLHSHTCRQRRQTRALPSTNLSSRNFLEEAGLELQGHWPPHPSPQAQPSPQLQHTQLRVKEEQEGDLRLSKGPGWYDQKAYLPWMQPLDPMMGEGGEEWQSTGKVFLKDTGWTPGDTTGRSPNTKHQRHCPPPAHQAVCQDIYRQTLFPGHKWFFLLKI